jgi:hypothetical protein
MVPYKILEQAKLTLKNFGAALRRGAGDGVGGGLKELFGQ